jgi:hypothetical protein
MELRSEQDPVSVSYMINLLRKLDGKVYMEIGCAQLGTFEKFRIILPDDGLAIGLDGRSYDNWDEYKDYVKTLPGCQNVHISKAGLHHKLAVPWVKKILKDRMIDFLLIDGDHNIEPTELDYVDFSPFVRSGGIIAFHDLDFGAYNRGERFGQGAAAMLSKLKSQGYSIGYIPGVIGMGYIRK